MHGKNEAGCRIPQNVRLPQRKSGCSSYKMGSNRNRLVLKCKSAVLSCLLRFIFHIPGEWGTHIDKWLIYCLFFFPFHFGQCFITGRFIIAFCIKLVDAHCKTPHFQTLHDKNSVILSSELPPAPNFFEFWYSFFPKMCYDECVCNKL